MHAAYSFLTCFTFFCSYIWHLYLSAFCIPGQSQRSKVLANTFRLIQAVTSSIPLILLNLYTLLSILQVDERTLDLNVLGKHLGQGLNGKQFSI